MTLGTEKLSKLPRITKLISKRLRVQPDAPIYPSRLNSRRDCRSATVTLERRGVVMSWNQGPSDLLWWQGVQRVWERAKWRGPLILLP